MDRRSMELRQHANTVVFDAVRALGGRHVTPIEVRKRTRMSASTISRAVRRLEEEGRLTRGARGELSIVEAHGPGALQAPPTPAPTFEAPAAGDEVALSRVQLAQRLVDIEEQIEALKLEREAVLARLTT